MNNDIADFPVMGKELVAQTPVKNGQTTVAVLAVSPGGLRSRIVASGSLPCHDMGKGIVSLTVGPNSVGIAGVAPVTRQVVDLAGSESSTVTKYKDTRQ
jgi:hypothetical protein